MMMGPETAIWASFGVAGVIVVNSIVGAIFLRWAVAAMNFLAGSKRTKNAVAAPTFRGAVKILFITFLVSAMACVVISLAVHFCADFLTAGQGYSRVLATLISICLSTVFSLAWMVRVVSATLPTTMLCSLGVTFIYWATAATIVWAIVCLTAFSWLMLNSIN